MVFEHGRRFHPDSLVVTDHHGTTTQATYAEVADRTDRLAAALLALGVEQGDRVATFGWNNQAHQEAYLAIPAIGAVLHTLNIRLDESQLGFIVEHAGDKVVIVDADLLPTIAPVLRKADSVEHVIVVGDPSGHEDALAYEQVLANHEPLATYPELDERQAAVMCYTSGTTGDPKGVVYDHRSMVLHAWGAGLAAIGLGITEHDRCLPVVPMFHANGWGIPHAAWMAGADMVMPGPDLSAANIARLIEEQRVTLAGAVPTIWNDILNLPEPRDISSLRMIVCGGAAAPRSLLERFQAAFDVEIIQAWGMTETGPLAALARRPKGAPESEEFDWRAKTGRILPGVEVRITDDNDESLPWDGEAEGEIEVRGPWCTAAYYAVDAPERFHNGWLRTGDVGTIDERGYIRITDRAKDVIKSGGEWISSLALEAEILAHPDVLEVAVIAVPDDRWTERPLPCVVLRDGATADAEALAAHTAQRVIKWSVPERWTFIDAVPRTSVGKFDKKRLRAQFAAGDLDIEMTR
jgi:fatty-acyl-CoA synthase